MKLCRMIIIKSYRVIHVLICTVRERQRKHRKNYEKPLKEEEEGNKWTADRKWETASGPRPRVEA